MPFKTWHVTMCSLGVEFNCNVRGSELRPLGGNDLEKSANARAPLALGPVGLEPLPWQAKSLWINREHPQ